MFSPRDKDRDIKTRALDIDEIRLVCDLRIMHAKVDELYELSRNLRERHDEPSIVTYADEPVLNEDIRKVDELYLWFVSIKEEIERRVRRRNTK